MALRPLYGAYPPASPYSPGATWNNVAVPAVPVRKTPEKIQAAIDAIEAIVLDDLVDENGAMIYNLNDIVTRSNNKSRLLVDSYYRSAHNTRYQQHLRRQQEDRQRQMTAAREGRIQWLKENLQIGSWIEGTYGTARYRRVTGILPDTVETLTGDPFSNRVTGRKTTDLQYSEIRTLFQPTTQQFKTVAEVSGIADPTNR